MSRQQLIGALRRCAGVFAAACALSAVAQMPPGNPEAPATDPAAQLARAKALFEQRPDPQTLAQIVRTLQTQPGVTADLVALASDAQQRAEALQKSMRGAEARRVLSRAITLLQGQAWDAKAEFAASLALRPDARIGDSNLHWLAQLIQVYPAAHAPEGRLQLKLSLTPARPGAAPGSPGRATEIAMVDVPVRDLNDQPLRMAARLPADLPDGAYTVLAEVMAEVVDGTSVVARTSSRVALLRSIEARRAEVEARLKRAAGREDTQASVRYPFELVRLSNAALIDPADHDFAASLARSTAILAALEAGKDPLFQATGDLYRHYHFADADEIMPYRLYVPTRWHSGQKWPLVLALHGGGQDENRMTTMADGVMQKLAEERGWIVVAPLGYRRNGDYGVPFPVPPALKATKFGFLPPFATPLRTLQLSEKDVLNVLDRVSAEYNVDAARVYIMGNSAGGGGTWIMTARFAERFAAAAPCASSMDIRGLPFERFKTVPVLVCIGELDVDVRKEVARYGVARINEAGGYARYLEVPKGTHGSGVEIAMPQLFEFFAQHRRP